MSGSTTVYYIVVDQDDRVTNYGAVSRQMWAPLASAIAAIGVPQAVYQTIAGSPDNTFFWRNSQLMMVSTTTPDVADSKVTAAAIVDSMAESARLRFITPGFGQMLCYMEKEREAASFLGAYPTEGDFQAASPQPTAAQYPLVFNEVGLTASDAWGVAAVFEARYQTWLAMGAIIERLRLQAQQTIAQATTLAEIDAALTISWPAPAEGTIAAKGDSALAAAATPRGTGSLTATASAT